MCSINARSGEGAFSTVFKVKRISDGQEYALKKVRKSHEGGFSRFIDCRNRSFLWFHTARPSNDASYQYANPLSLHCPTGKTR